MLPIIDCGFDIHHITVAYLILKAKWYHPLTALSTSSSWWWWWWWHCLAFKCHFWASNFRWHDPGMNFAQDFTLLGCSAYVLHLTGRLLFPHFSALMFRGFEGGEKRPSTVVFEKFIQKRICAAKGVRKLMGIIGLCICVFFSIICWCVFTCWQFAGQSHLTLVNIYQLGDFRFRCT